MRRTCSRRRRDGASRRSRTRAGAIAGALLLLGCDPPPDVAQSQDPTPSPGRFGRLDRARLERADAEPENWFTNGRDRQGSYFSPLDDIDEQSVSELGFAWEYGLGTARGLEATPVVIDGILYAVGNWGRLYALDAKTGREIWTYDPEPDGQWSRYACCDVVNRGLAVWQGTIYVGSLDGFLHAVDAASGARIWKVDTLSPESRQKHRPYTITGAPQVAGDVVVIGNGGADFGVRGYVTAYDLGSGEQRWRFYTVPRDPKEGPQDQPHLVSALETWDRDGDWSFGGGGTVWDGMAYDPELDLVYIGTGNASPYAWRERSPSGGDNLYLASVVAIHAATGEMAWHFQQVPGENWDYTSTAKMILADLTIAGTLRRVLMHAPKNGFFYVLDRASGELISAAPFTYVNWTKGLEPGTGRPVPNAEADYSSGPRAIAPSMAGAHNWHPMSFSPATGLVYIPVIDAPWVFIDARDSPLVLVEGTFSVLAVPPEDYDPAAMEPLLGPLPPLDRIARGLPEAPRTRGVIRAWDPVNQKLVWERETQSFWDGGLMSTAGNLVFRGDAAGFLSVYSADRGELLERIDVGTSIMAAPTTYRVDGEQYVAVMAGFGGGGSGAYPPGSAAREYGNSGRIVAFKLGGGATPKPARVVYEPFAEPPVQGADPGDIAAGALLYTRYCARCHLFGPGLMPDLRRMSATTHTAFSEIVLRGIYAPKGMGRFDDLLSQADVEAIHAYLVQEARSAYEQQQAGSGS